MTRLSSVGITMGDPAGVGPEIVCRALADLSPADRAGIVVFGTKSILERANELTRARLSFGELNSTSRAGAVPVVDIRIPGSESVRDGIMTAAAGACSYAYIERAVSAALAGDISVIATAPINKEALHAAGYLRRPNP
jgi:4-hydroxythreonine-4-phosphate dehydrogenase